MDYQDIRMARQQAVRDIEVADAAIRQAAQLISGRLRSSGVQVGVLEELKRELKDFNLKTYEWIDRR